jgi:hypothetical protein
MAMTTEQQINVLKKSIETVEFKIKNLSKYYPSVQVKQWKLHRKKLKNSLEKWKKFHREEQTKLKNKPYDANTPSSEIRC